MTDAALDAFNKIREKRGDAESFAKEALTFPHGKDGAAVTNSQLAALMTALYEHRIISSEQFDSTILELMRAA